MRPNSWQLVDIRTQLNEEIQTISFDSDKEGAWQKIPNETLEQLKDLNIDLCIKFGMGLLRNPNEIPSKHGILSFHHGDPSKYRGRPAGFYEVYNDEKKVGAMVQRISNKLDSGKIYAFGSYKLFPYSYKKTLDSLYSGSSNLLFKAVENIVQENQLNIDSSGKNYRVPSNTIGILFLLKISKKLFSRIIYGLFFEKAWVVGLTKIPAGLFNESITELSDYETLRPPKGYTFLADGFFSQKESNTFFAEGLNQKTGKGDVLKLSTKNKISVFQQIPIASAERHSSYPFSFIEESSEYLVICCKKKYAI